MTEARSTAPTTAPTNGSLPNTSAFGMYAVVLGVGIICSFAIVTVYETTRPIIRRNTIELRNQAVLDVLPAARTSAAFRFTEAGRFVRTSPDDKESELVFAGYDGDLKLVGLAIETHGMGYQDVVRVIFGYSFEEQAIIGIRVLQSRETPGLGDRIETDVDFLRNFESLDVRLNSEESALIHPIEFVKPGTKREAWQIDGISGATISSRATADMLRESSAKWMPRVYARRADFAFVKNED